MEIRQLKFKLPKGCSIKEVVIRETTGKDEAAALISSKALGDKGSFLNEMLKLSVVEYDGEPVVQPFVELEEWTSKTRAFVLKAYLKVNSTEDEETNDFFASAEVVSGGSKNTVAIDELFGSGGSGSRGTSAGA